MAGTPPGEYDRSVAGSLAHHDVIYDGGCRVCIRTVWWLRRLDWLQRLRFVTVDSIPDDQSSRLALNRHSCLEAMHVVSPRGNVTAGFDAVRELLWQIPAFWLLAPLMYLPGVPSVGPRVYRFVAENRTTACRIEPVRDRSLRER
jgi:predicted DCC family thiol-disulfide oxidoreductase YuxK